MTVLAALVAALVSMPLTYADRGVSLSSPYRSESFGYDLSYPDCVRVRPAAKAFAILGVNGGNAFTFNRCLRRESGWYRNAAVRAFYLNTGYEPRFRALIIASCRGSVSIRRGTVAEAYAIGCSEAATSVHRVLALGLGVPPLWWLDVETANSWSAKAAINTAVIRGVVDFLASLRPAPTIGIYSRPRWWREITAGWLTRIPEWVPSPASTCPAPFSAGPVWLHQIANPDLDIDTAC